MLNTRASESSGEVDALLDGRHPAGRTPPPPPYCCPYPCPYCTLTPPLPTVAPTRVPTVHPLPPSQDSVFVGSGRERRERGGARSQGGPGRNAAPCAPRRQIRDLAVQRRDLVGPLLRAAAPSARRPPGAASLAPPQGVLRPLRRRKGCC